MIGDPNRLRQWAAHWVSRGHDPNSGLLLAREVWETGDGGTELWELRLADLSAGVSLIDLLAQKVTYVDPSDLPIQEAAFVSPHVRCTCDWSLTGEMAVPDAGCSAHGQ